MNRFRSKDNTTQEEESSDSMVKSVSQKNSVREEKSPGNEFEQLYARLRKSDFSTLPATDHRRIGEKLDLFSFYGASPGMVYWHNNGLTIRNLLMDFIRSELKKRDYIEISTPALANTALWQISGHWDHYKDDMFLTSMKGEDDFGLKPMNCPSTFLVYKSKKWSYRDMPVRMADFDQLYRNELSGVSSGLFRVKSFIQDDAHIFMRDDQIDDEIGKQLDLLKKLYGVFNLTYKLKLSTMPNSHIGDESQWNKAEDILKKNIIAKNLPYEVKAKEGAFYGPKIDVDVKDSMGREWQCATFQLDFQMPKRFKLSYIGDDSKEYTPVVLHRVIYGSIERFIGILVEHYQGRFPTWISPIQVRVLPVSEKNEEYARKVYTQLRNANMRVELDISNKTLASKVKDAEDMKIPYILVIGKKEEESESVSIRSGGINKNAVHIDRFISDLAEEIESKAPPKNKM